MLHHGLIRESGKSTLPTEYVGQLFHPFPYLFLGRESEAEPDVVCRRVRVG
jgi:hypothetical protein